MKEQIREVNGRVKDAAIAFAGGLPPQDQEMLLNWIIELLEIHESTDGRPTKLKRMVASTKKHKAVWPIVKGLKFELVKHGWTDRGQHARWGIAGSAAGIAVFGLQGAGIAALGGAVGVPLWFIFGGGAAVASVVRDELARKKP